jgi:hypothetical protein
MTDGSGPTIAAGTAVEVIRYDASMDGLLVNVLSGPLTGRKGWVLSNVQDGKGAALDSFDHAVEELPKAA